MIDSELLYLLKYGRSDEIQLRMDTEKKAEYSGSFPAFMDEMLKEHRVKRKDVAIRAGMSQDYTYKLLRGDKKTTERDYILAICIAIGMNLPQTQHALHIYGMPILDKRDLRSQVIMLGIEDGRDIDDINMFLEKARFPYIKTTPDMPSAEIRLITDMTAPAPVIEHTYKEIDREITAEPCGLAPMDFMYSGMIHLQDEEENDFTVSATYAPEGAFFFTLRGKPGDHNEDIDSYFIEAYGSIVEAAASPFLRFYLELDEATDEKVAETLAMVDDTKNYGVRVGCHVAGTIESYLEAFNTQKPERREYFQIVRFGDDYTYSVTHESLFMRIELGPIYPLYFGKKEEPQYLVKVSDPAEAAKVQLNYKFILTELRHYLNTALGEQAGEMFQTDESDTDQVELYAQYAALAMQQGDAEEAIRLNKKVYEISKNGEDVRSQVISLITAWKIGSCYHDKDDMKEWATWTKTVTDYSDAVQEWYEDEENRPSAIQVSSILADAFRTMSFLAKKCNLLNDAKEYGLKALNWYDRCEMDDDTAYSYADALAFYAALIDGDEPERSLDYTEKALMVAQRHHIDRTRRGVKIMEAVLNNHAWVLWNRLGSEEAIIYYGRAVDLVESAVKDEDDTEMLEPLKHVAVALYGIYEVTGKQREKDRLAARMRKYNMDLTETEE